jgi:hypothetical protein
MSHSLPSRRIKTTKKRGNEKRKSLSRSQIKIEKQGGKVTEMRKEGKSSPEEKRTWGMRCIGGGMYNYNPSRSKTLSPDAPDVLH